MQADKRVTTIPASISRFTALPVASQQKRKVAAYARVSTDSDEQFTSYEAQIDYYTKMITAREDWEFVTVYTDEGISALNTKHRDGFKQMVKDALDGKIDLIVTKSVSRFARNTVDSLVTIRKLKEEARAEKRLIDVTEGRRTRAIIILDSGHLVLSSVQPETINQRLLASDQEQRNPSLPPAKSKGDGHE